MIILYILLILLALTVLFLSLALYHFAKKSICLSKKEKEYIIFVIDIFEQYFDNDNVQSKEEHKKLVEELEKIKNKHLKK